MKKVLKIILAVLIPASTLCSCGDGNSADLTSEASASTSDAKGKNSLHQPTKTPF